MSCRIPHFLYDTHGLVEEAGLLPVKALAVPDQGKVLAGGAEGYHMDGRDLPPVQLRDVPQVQHVRETAELKPIYADLKKLRDIQYKVDSALHDQQRRGQKRKQEVEH